MIVLEKRIVKGQRQLPLNLMMIIGAIVQKRWGYCLDPRCHTMIDLNMKALEKGGNISKRDLKEQLQ